MQSEPIPNFRIVDGSLSQAFQESFLLNALSFKEEGFFLEIGAGDGVEASNTYLLDKQFSWQGLSVEWDADLHDKFEKSRTTKCVCLDATAWNPKKSLKDADFPKQIDYLQIDIDPASQSLKALMNLPFDEYRFSVITFEHDYYVSSDEFVRDESRKFLQAAGYHLFAAGVETRGRNFEDWWIDPTIDSLKPLTAFQYLNVEARTLFMPGE